MQRSEIEETVIAIAAKATGSDAEALSMDKTWKGDLSAKSTHIMKVLALTKMRTGVEVMPADLEACVTLGDLADFIEKNQ